MPGKIALVDFNKCNPQICNNGVCLAAQACTHKMLKQEAPNEIPMPDPFLCRGCSDCVRACPLGAIKIVRA